VDEVTRISCFLPSHNKGDYVIDALASIFSQDYNAWELFIVENSTDGGHTRGLIKDYLGSYLDDPSVHYHELDDLDEERGKFYITAWLMNMYYPKANGDIIFYLSDDDVLDPKIFGRIVRHFDENPEIDALYFHLARGFVKDPGEGINMESSNYPPILADIIRGPDDVDCQIDGGQVAYRTSVLEKLEKPWIPDSKGNGANHADGLHLVKVATVAPIHPLHYYGVKHRFTPVSVWSRSYS
jgi:hypothetical protein